MIPRFRSFWRNPWIGWLFRLASAAFALAALLTKIDFADVLNTVALVQVRLLLPVLMLYFAIR